MKLRKRPWRNDPRSKKLSHHRYFGTIAPKDLVETLDRPEGYLHDQEDTIRCTGYGSAASGECIHGVVMSPDWAAYKIGKKMGRSVDENGGDPNATMKHIRDDGFLPIGKAPFNLQRDGIQGSGFDAPWPKELDDEAAKWDTVPGYVRLAAGDSPYDIFDEIRSALQKAYDFKTRTGAPVEVFGRWNSEWTNSPDGIIPSQYNQFAGYHRYIFDDFKTINGIPYIRAKNSYGVAVGRRGFHLFPREVINREFTMPGTSLKICKTLKKEWVEEAKKETQIGWLWRWIMEAWFNISEKFGGITEDQGLIASLKKLVEALQIYLDMRRKEIPKPKVDAPVPPPPPTPVESKYLWDTKANIRHSIRVICDEEGLTLEQKNTMCATIQAESGFLLTAVNHNRRADGTIASTDWGLCQWNSYWHGKEITPQESVHNPEKAVRLMCQYWKRGQRNLWIAYKNGSYKKYL